MVSRQRDTVLLTDTVGFIRKLPHHLVASLHSTLIEAIEADLLLHVVDAALTGARHLEGWFCDEAVVEPGVGGRLVMRWTGPHASPQAYEARWQAWDPPRVCACATRCPTVPSTSRSPSATAPRGRGHSRG